MKARTWWMVSGALGVVGAAGMAIGNATGLEDVSGGGAVVNERPAEVTVGSGASSPTSTDPSETDSPSDSPTSTAAPTPSSPATPSAPSPVPASADSPASAASADSGG